MRLASTVTMSVFTDVFISHPGLSHNTDISYLTDVGEMQKLVFVLELVKSLPESLQQVIGGDLYIAHHRERVRIRKQLWQIC